MAGIIDTLTPSQQLELVYIGYFNRSADGGGFNFWDGQYASAIAGGQSATQALNNIANSFTPQPETIALYPFLGTQGPLSPNNPVDVAGVNSLLNSVYMNLFDRAPDASGQAYWAHQLLTNAVPLGTAVLAIANGAIGNDLTLEQNKISAALDFTTTTAGAGLGLNSATRTAAYLSEAAYILTLVTTDPASVTTADNATAAFIANGGGVSQTLFTLTTGADSIAASGSTLNGVAAPAATGNDLIKGVVDGVPFPNNSTLQVFDTINPGGTHNAVAITLVNGGAITGAHVPVLSNIQALVSTDISSPGVINDLTGIAPNLTSIGVTGDVFGQFFRGFDGSQVKTIALSNLTPAAPILEKFMPNPGLSASGAASGSATVQLTNVAANAAGAGNVVLDISGASATDGFGAVTLSSLGIVANDLLVFTDTALKTLNITGPAALTIDNPISFATTTANIQAGTDTGGVTISVDNGLATVAPSNVTKVTFVGGSGVDTLTVSETQLTNAATSLNGGTGTSNTLVVDAYGLAGFTAADYTALTTSSSVTGFHTLGLEVNAAAFTVNAGTGGLAGAYTSFAVTSDTAAHGVTISAMADNSTVTLNTSSTDVFAKAVGASTLNVNVGAAGAAAGLADTATVTGWSTLNLTSNGTGAAANVITLTNSDATAIHLSGAANTTLNISLATTTGDTIDASQLSGTFTFADSGKGDVISTGSGKAIILENSLSDTFNLLSGHTNAATITFSATNNSAAPDTVNNFVLNLDVLKNASGALHQGNAADMTGVITGTGMVAGGTYASATSFINAAEATTTAAAGDTVAYTIGGNTYVAEFTAAGVNHAHIVDLVGVTTATAVGGAGAGHILIA